MKIKTLLMIGGLLAFGGTAQAQTMGLEAGEWELVMTAETLGESMQEKDKSCTTPEDLTTTVPDFMADLAEGTGCSIGSISQTRNVYKTEMTCNPADGIKGGDITMITSPRSFSLTLNMETILSTGEPDGYIYLLSNRIGPCPN